MAALVAYQHSTQGPDRMMIEAPQLTHLVTLARFAFGIREPVLTL